MKLILQRQASSQKSTVGTLAINGQFECYTLEDVVRPAGSAKVYGKTAIPAGCYAVIFTFSNRFKKVMPLLLKVPGFEGVRIHAGNTAEDTEGCILLGISQAPDFVGNSRQAYQALINKLQAAASGSEKIELTICDALPSKPVAVPAKMSKPTLKPAAKPATAARA